MRSIFKNTDYLILILALILCIIGVIGIYSAGANSTSDTEYIKQLMWIGISLVVLFAVWTLDYQVSSVIGMIGYPIVLILLVLVLFTPAVNGASSWFNIGSIQIQPSEFMKIEYILLLAKYIDYVYTKGKDAINKFKYIAVALGIFALPVILIMLQPDLGTALVFASITFFMLFKSGLSYKYVIALLLVVIIAAPLLYFFVLVEYQQERIQVFFNPEQEPLGAGYNAIQSKIAVGSGMLFGTGLTKGTQTQWGYLPVKSSDFIFSVISEEMGFIISALIVVIFVAMLYRILKISETAKDRLGSTIVAGVFGMFFFHFLENIGMTIGLMPITGIPLPFLSYGGSSMLTNFIALALVLAVSGRRQRTLFVE